MLVELPEMLEAPPVLSLQDAFQARCLLDAAKHCLLDRQPMFQPLEIDDVWPSRRLYCSDFDAVKP